MIKTHFAKLLIIIIILANNIGIPLFAAPVEWIPVSPTLEGKQWWDKGSIRKTSKGTLTVLSRFVPNNKENSSSKLFVMDIDCELRLFRDKQINGIPRFRSEWQSPDSDELINNVIRDVCNYSPVS